MTKLHVFGDSYSTPDFCVSPSDSWWALTAAELQVDETRNYAWCGNNLENILHTIVCYINEFSKQDYIIIAVPPLQRLTMFDPDNSSVKKISMWNKQTQCVHEEDVLSHSSLVDLNVHEMGKKYVELFDSSWNEACALRSILMLLAYLNNRVDNVLIANASVPFSELTNWSVLRPCQEQVFSDARVELFKTYYTVNFEKHKPVDFDTFGWMGHHGAEGNREWFDTVLKPKMKELKWL